ncbi:MAG: tryptophan 7-halogenase [Steroidobacteraceae bacterium]
MPEPDLACEVCVVGGGPGGAILARRLAMLGRDVCLAERAMSGAGRPGESLAPGILPLLDAAGVRAAFEALGPLRAPAAVVRWATSEAERVAHPALLVERARLDDALLAAAAQAGVRVLRPATAGRPTRDGGGWRIPLRVDGRACVMDARIVCDATGRRGLFRDGAPRRSGARTLALTTYALDAELALPVVEALAGGWLWAAPLPDGRASVMVFVDALGAHGARDRVLRAHLAASPIASGWTDFAPVVVRDATTRARDPVVAHDALRIGEAAFSIDPLSAQGVQAAIGTALHAAIVVHTLLAAPARTDAALAFYHARCDEAVARHAAWSARFYAERARPLAGTFWARRTDALIASPFAAAALLAGSPVARPAALTLAGTATMTAIPCIVDDLIDLVPALHHPALDRPVAYLGDTALAPLLGDVGHADSPVCLVEKWSRRVSPARAHAILDWLVARGVLEAAL